MSEFEVGCGELSENKFEIEDLCSIQKKLNPYTKNYKRIFARRQIIIEYFLDLHNKLNTQYKTLHLAISSFDNFMSILDEAQSEVLNPVEITKISLVSFYVAYKYQESLTLTIDMIQKHFIKNSCEFEKEEFIRLETLFLKTISFKLYYVNLHSFHESFYDYLLVDEIYRPDEEFGYKNFITDLMELNERVLTIITSLKEIMFVSNNCENFGSLKISELAVVSIKISILFFDSRLEVKQKKLKKINMKLTEFFSISHSENLNLNRCALNLFFYIKDMMKKEDRKIYRGLREISRNHNLEL